MKKFIILTITLSAFLLSCNKDENYYTYDTPGKQNATLIQQLVDEGYTSINITFLGTSVYYRNITEFTIYDQFIECTVLTNPSNPNDKAMCIVDLNRLQRIEYNNPSRLSLYF